MTRKYNFTIEGVLAQVEAEEEGQNRYMVRMSLPGRMSKIRIGYLTGFGYKWVAEFFGGKQFVAASASRIACFSLASLAFTRPDIRQCIEQYS